MQYLDEHSIAYSCYNHPEGKTIEEAKRWWRNDGSVHCKNLFFRNHKGNQHYLVCFDSDYDLAIHDLEQMLKEALVSAGQKAPGKLSFASAERMLKYLGLEPGSVSPFGLINDEDNHVILFLDENLFEILRNIDDEVTHLFKFADYIHIVNACLIVLSAALDLFNL